MPRMLLSCTINGEPSELLVQPYHTLLEAVRDVARLTGTKEGCGTGDCGACTVQLDGKPVASCLVLAMQARGRDVRTVEGLATAGSLNAVQAAFVAHGVPQCGFCIPGMVVGATALLERKPDPTEAEIREALAPHLCRCGTHARIIEAVKRAAAALAE